MLQVHPPQLDKGKIAEINKLTASIAPIINNLILMLRDAGIHEFDIGVANGAERLVWQDSKVTFHSPNEFQLTEEIMRILDEAYPPHSGFNFMGLIWNPNRAIAERMSKVISEFRKRDRSQIESQILGLLAAFKQGS